MRPEAIRVIFVADSWSAHILAKRSFHNSIVKCSRCPQEDVTKLVFRNIVEFVGTIGECAINGARVELWGDGLEDAVRCERHVVCSIFPPYIVPVIGIAAFGVYSLILGYNIEEDYCMVGVFDIGFWSRSKPISKGFICDRYKLP